MFLGRIFVCLFLLFTFCLTPVAEARSCFDWPAIFNENRSLFTPQSNEKKLLILPFINETGTPRLQWLGEAFRLGLFQLLETANHSNVIEMRSPQTTFIPEEAAQLGQAVGADYVIAGQYRGGAGELKVFTHLVDVAKGGSLELNEEGIEWPNPQKFTDLLVYLARRASKAFDRIKVDKKKLAYLKNEPRSLAAFEHWTLGWLAQEKATVRNIGEARKHYQEAVNNDFNYCYGYLGVAQAWAELGFIAKLRGKPYKDSYQKAQRELTKGALLCPEVAKAWQKRATQYLQADVFQTTGQDRARKGEWGKAIEQLEKGVALLPGDVLARRGLAQAYRHRGRSEAAQKQTATLSSLARCR